MRPMDILLNGEVSWHRHSTDMLSVIKRGLYTEQVLEGAYNVKKGLVVVTHAYAPHADYIAEVGASINNFPMPNNFMNGGVYELPEFANREEWPRNLEDIAEVLPLLRPVPIQPPEDWLVHARSHLIILQSVQKAAQSIGVSREYFQRSFRKAYGMSPGQALREHKIEEALQALRTVKPLADIAYDTNFSDQSHMTRLIRSATGISPKKFHKQHVTLVQD